MGNLRKVYARTDLCTGCRSCEIACAVEHSASKELLSALYESPPPRHRMDVQYAHGVKLPLNCRHCAEPDCLFACKAGAITKDASSGEVQIDLRKCVGCWMCVMVCPFGAVAPDLDQAKAVKCDLCLGRTAGPSCVASCPTKALLYGDNPEFEAWRRP
jgi:anaerobic carbon-monoxide dehydrogenase iron sulfur subunit